MIIKIKVENNLDISFLIISVFGYFCMYNLLMFCRFLTWMTRTTMEYFVMIQYFGVLLLACLTGMSKNFHSFDTRQVLQACQTNTAKKRSTVKGDEG